MGRNDAGFGGRFRVNATRPSRIFSSIFRPRDRGASDAKLVPGCGSRNWRKRRDIFLPGALVLPAEVVFPPKIREPIAADRFLSAGIEAVCQACRVRLSRSWLFEHATEIDEMLLRPNSSALSREFQNTSGGSSKAANTRADTSGRRVTIGNGKNLDPLAAPPNTWLDGIGHPRSESARMTERFHRRDFGHLDVEVTVNDPVYYTRAFTVKLPFHLIPDSDVLEAVCAENEKDRVHLAN